MNTIIKTFAANISYSGMTYNTLINVEYKHTGTQFYCKKPRQKHETVTDSKEIAEGWINKKLKVTEKPGYYYIDRISVPTINAKGEKDIWYINNSGDSYRINKVSKYGKKIHEQFSQHQQPIK